MAKRGSPTTAWKPGQSGNPAGRATWRCPVTNRSVREIAALHTDAAIDTLVRICTNKDGATPHPAQVSAAEALLNRGHGKPAQPVGDEDGNALDLIAILTERRARLDG